MLFQGLSMVAAVSGLTAPHNPKCYTLCKRVCIILHLHIANVLVCCIMRVFLLAQGSREGRCWLTEKKSRVRNDSDEKAAGLETDQKEESEISHCLLETKRRSQSDRGVYRLSLSPVDPPASFGLNCMHLGPYTGS